MLSRNPQGEHNQKLCIWALFRPHPMNFFLWLVLICILRYNKTLTIRIALS